MSRQLLILRHGKSDWDIDVDDFDRPLKKRGKQAAQQLGLWLKQQKLLPDHIVSSSAKRASSTTETLVKAMGFMTNQINYDSRIYAAGLNDLIAVLSDCPTTTNRVLMVGHNPGLEDLLVFLSKDIVVIPEDGKLLPTATLAILEMPMNWSTMQQTCAVILSITRPSDYSV